MAQNDVQGQPSGWVQTTLENSVDILDRHRVPVNATEREERIAGKPASELFPYFGATGQVGWIDDYLFDDELVLLGEDGAPFLEPFKAKAYIIRGRTWVNNHAHVLRALAGLTSNSYLCHYLNSADYHDYVTGTTRLKLNQSRMRQIPVPIAPLPEQRRIVTEIETQFTRLEAGVTALKRAQANLRRYKASVLKAACEGRLVPTEAELARQEGRGYEPAEVLLERILAERRSKWEAESPGKEYQEPKAQDTSELPDLPEGWVGTTLENCVDILDRQRIPVNRTERQERTAGKPLSRLYPYYGATGQVDWIDDYIFDEELVLLGEDGAPFFEPFKNKAYIIRGKTWVNNHAHVLRALTELVSSSYLCNALNVADYHEHVTGTTRLKLNQSRMKEIPIALAPWPEQRRIVAEVERRLSVAVELEKQVEVALRRAERLRQAILKHAFEGKLVPQDPNDEPASVLLARIKAERSGKGKKKAKEGKPEQLRLI